MGDMADGFHQQGMGGGKRGVAVDFAPTDIGAKSHAVGIGGDGPQARHFFEIDQEPGRGEAKREKRHQALAAR